MLQKAKYRSSLPYKFGVVFDDDIVRVKIKFAIDMWLKLEKEFAKAKSDHPMRYAFMSRTLQYCVTGRVNKSGTSHSTYYTVFGTMRADDYRLLQFIITRAKYAVMNDKLFQLDCDLLGMADKYDLHATVPTKTDCWDGDDTHHINHGC